MDIRNIGLSKGRKLAMSWALCGFLAMAPAAAMADSLEMSKNAGLGVGSAMASLVYAPVKLCYAIGGLVVGGLAWAFSGGDKSVAKVVLTPSVLGDYVITPAHLRGTQTIEFFGRDPDYRLEKTDVAASAPEQDYDQAW